MRQATILDENVLIVSLVDETIAERLQQLPRVNRHWLSGYKPRRRSERGTIVQPAGNVGHHHE